ncbi:hypothetical protein T492DRAFT_844332 [Pavlovales sp. CCMP2436]|nr:hypothetical protein T492DRAFT_844332 [Pavlovales sp. CCMP2436]
MQSASPPPLASSAAAAATALVSAVVAKPTTTRSMAAKTGGGAEVQAGEQVGVAHLMAAGLGDCPYGTSAQRGQGTYPSCSRARARAVRRMSKGSGGESRGGSQPQTPVRAGGGAAGSPARVGALRVRVPGSQGAVSESGSQSHPDW